MLTFLLSDSSEEQQWDLLTELWGLNTLLESVCLSTVLDRCPIRSSTFLFSPLPNILVHLGCYDKKKKKHINKLGGFINSRHLFHPVLEAGSPRLWHQHGLILEKALWVADWPLLCVLPRRKEEARSLCAVSFRRTWIAFMGLCPRDLKAPAPNTITFVGFNIWISGGHNHLDQIAKNTWRKIPGMQVGPIFSCVSIGPSESQPGCTLESPGGRVFKIPVPNPYHRPTTWDFPGSGPEALVDFRSSPRDSDVLPELKIITLDLSKLFICDVIYETSHSSLSSTVANGHMWLANTWNVFSLKSGEL